MADEHHRMVYRSARPGRTAVLMLAGSEGWEGTATGVLGSLSLTWGGLGNIVVPVTADGPHPAFRPVVKAFDPDWISTYTTTNHDFPQEGNGRSWIIEVGGDDAATVSGWCSPFPGKHDFHPWAGRGVPVHRPLIPATAFPQAWTPEVIDLDLSGVNPLLALMVRMRTGTLAGTQGSARHSAVAGRIREGRTRTQRAGPDRLSGGETVARRQQYPAHARTACQPRRARRSLGSARSSRWSGPVTAWHASSLSGPGPGPG